MSELAASVKTIFDRMPERLNASAAEGLEAVIQYELGGEGGTTYHSEIKDGRCTVSEGEHEDPTMTLTMAASDFLDLMEGRRIVADVLDLTVRYYACDDALTFCIPVRQDYKVHLARDWNHDWSVRTSPDGTYELRVPGATGDPPAES